MCPRIPSQHHVVRLAKTRVSNHINSKISRNDQCCPNKYLMMWLCEAISSYNQLSQKRKKLSLTRVKRLERRLEIWTSVKWVWSIQTNIIRSRSRPSHRYQSPWSATTARSAVAISTPAQSPSWVFWTNLAAKITQRKTSRRKTNHQSKVSSALTNSKLQNPLKRKRKWKLHNRSLLKSLYLCLWSKNQIHCLAFRNQPLV